MLMTYEGNRSAWIAVVVAAAACAAAYANWRSSSPGPVDTSDSPPARTNVTESKGQSSADW